MMLTALRHLDKVIKDYSIEINDKAYECLVNVMDNFNSDLLYTTKNFSNGYSLRKILEYNLSDKAAEDKTAIDEAIAAGVSRDEVLSQYTTDEAFENWYKSILCALNSAAGK